MLQQRHEKALADLEQEMKVEMQRARDTMNEQLNAEMMAALSVCITTCVPIFVLYYITNLLTIWNRRARENLPKGKLSMNWKSHQGTLVQGPVHSLLTRPSVFFFYHLNSKERSRNNRPKSNIRQNLLNLLYKICLMANNIAYSLAL